MPPIPYSEVFRYEKRYWYPHMKPYDVAIWERFIARYPNAYISCQYDVPVGSDPHFPTEVSERENDEEWKLYQKKIDVVASGPQILDIIELKPGAGAAAVGQVKMYKKLFMKDYNPPLEPRAVIITDHATPDFREFARDEGVMVIVV